MSLKGPPPATPTPRLPRCCARDVNGGLYFRPIFKSDGDRIRSTLTEAFGPAVTFVGLRLGLPNARRRFSWRRRRWRNALMKMATRRRCHAAKPRRKVRIRSQIAQLYQSEITAARGNNMSDNRARLTSVRPISGRITLRCGWHVCTLISVNITRNVAH